MLKAVTLASALPALLLAVEPAGQWSGFRGSGDSHSAANLPLSWSDRHNVAWKIQTPGFGQSTPVVRNGRIFLTAVEGQKKDRLLVLSLDAATGKTIWTKTFDSSRPQEAGDRVARAASTPALDEKAIYTLFDSGDLLALDHDGAVLWKKNFNTEYAPIQNGHDFGSSLRQSVDTLYAFVNHVGPSYLVAIAKKDGSTRWKAELPAEGGWNTPLLAGSGKQQVLLIQRKGGVAAYDPHTGKPLWEDLREFSRENAIPSLSVSRGIAVVPSLAKGGTYAFKLDQPKQPLWKATAATNAFSSPLLTGKRAYLVNSVGALFAVDLDTGRDLWNTRLPATTWASAISAGDRVYFFTGDGSTYIFRDSETMEKLAENHLEANSLVYATTPLEGALLLRTGNTLWKVAELGEKDPNPLLSKRAAPAVAKEEPPPPAAPPGKPGEVRTNPVDGLKLAWIPAGTFRMGCSEGDAECDKEESPAHAVTLSRGFWLNTTEVTVGAYKKFAAATNRTMPAEPAIFQTKVNPGWSDDTQPMVKLSLQEAKAYCRWTGGRVPTEAEWEYAARAGSSTARHATLTDIAWFADNSGREPLDATRLAREQRGAYMPTLEKNGNRPHAAGTKKPNAFGLFDMLGNVAEWTTDWHDAYPAAAVTDPKGPPDGEKRIARGGAWTFGPNAIRSSARLKLSIDAVNDFTGVRCAQ
jgi:outer membrane protein assembly factor BamB